MCPAAPEICLAVAELVAVFLVGRPSQPVLQAYLGVCLVRTLCGCIRYLALTPMLWNRSRQTIPPRMVYLQAQPLPPPGLLAGACSVPVLPHHPHRLLLPRHKVLKMPICSATTMKRLGIHFWQWRIARPQMVLRPAMQRRCSTTTILTRQPPCSVQLPHRRHNRLALFSPVKVMRPM